MDSQLDANLSKSALVQKEENLIELIRERPYLYDKSHKDYKDVMRKRNAFGEIDQALGVTSGKSLSIWNSLKKQYLAYLKKLQNPSGSGAGKAPSFRHAAIMSFYQAIYRPYKSSSNLDEEDDDGDFRDDVLDPSAPVTPSDYSVEYEGFDEGDEPEIVIHEMATGSTPKLSKTRPSKRRRESNFDEKLLAAIEKSTVNDGDEFDHFGAYISGKIRKIHSKHPRAGAELQLEIQKLITESEFKILEEATLNDAGD